MLPTCGTHCPIFFKTIPREVLSLGVESSIDVDIMGLVVRLIPLIIFEVPG